MNTKFQVRLYDTYQGKVVPFVPLQEGKVSIYYCGPTVYNFAHIGNFRPPIFFDLVARFFKELGYEVKMVSNYTDIDDKIIKSALEEKKSEKDLSAYYIDNYEEQLKALNVAPLYCHPKVSECMDDIIHFVGKALKEDKAYIAGDDVYFSVDKVEDYGSLSKMKIDDLIAGSRIAVSEGKKSPLDFVLWKKTDDQGIKFDAPFGKGRPGWHTECLVMINKIFGEPLIDIHGGGFDLKFPHHENERAQSMAVYHTPLAKQWMHVGFINMGEDKMSKSLGNVVLMKDFNQAHDPDIFRLFILKGYYRSPISYTEEAIVSAESEVKKYRNLKKAFNYYLVNHALNGEGTLLEEFYDPFMEALSDDFNVPNALAAFDNLVKASNLALRQNKENEILSLLFTFNRLHSILGLSLKTPKISLEIKELILSYEQARQEKNYARSDELRKKLIELDIL